MMRREIGLILLSTLSRNSGWKNIEADTRQVLDQAYRFTLPLKFGVRERAFTSARNHKRLKTSHRPEELLPVDMHDQYMETDIIPLGEDESFDSMRFWNDRYSTQPDLARMALDALAVPAMSDECERLSSSTKLLLTDRCSCLRMDIVEACECLRAWYGPPPTTKKPETFDEKSTGQREIDQGVHDFNSIDGAHSSEPTSDWEDGSSYGNM